MPFDVVRYVVRTSFGRRSDVVRNLEQHAYGIAYFTSFSRFWGGESSLCCDHFHLTSTCGESSAFQYDLFVFRKVKCHFDDGLVVASTMCFLIFHTTKLAKTECVVPRRSIGIALVFGQLI